MRARVYVTLKREVLDPQGEAVRKGLQALGLTGIREVRVGKVIEIELDRPVPVPGAGAEAGAGGVTAVAPTLESTEAILVEIRAVADKLLANPVIEDYRVEIEAG